MIYYFSKCIFSSSVVGNSYCTYSKYLSLHLGAHPSSFRALPLSYVGVNIPMSFSSIYNIFSISSICTILHLPVVPRFTR